MNDVDMSETIPEHLRGSSRDMSYTTSVNSIEALLHNMAMYIRSHGSMQLVPHKYLSSYFAATSHRLGTTMNALLVELVDQGHCIVLHGRRNGRLLLSAPYHKMLLDNVPPNIDPLVRAVEVYYETVDYEELRIAQATGRAPKEPRLNKAEKERQALDKDVETLKRLHAKERELIATANAERAEQNKPSELRPGSKPKFLQSDN